jgi:hypothetical protein
VANASSLRSSPSLRSGHITDKREIKDFPKLPSATSFIRKTLAEIRELALWKQRFIKGGF